MNPAPIAERPALLTNVSQEIAALVCEVMGLERQISSIEVLLTRKGEIEHRIGMLQDLERTIEGWN